MSTEEVAPEKKTERSSRRRRSNNPRSRNTKPDDRAEPETVSEPNSNSERPPRVIIETAPISPELVGTTVLGRISDFNLRRKGKFGFINIGDNVKPEKETPRIYFKLKDFADKDLLPRRGYYVELKVNLDEDARFFASDITLTPEGRKSAEEEKAKRALSNPPSGRGEASARPRRPVKVVEEGAVEEGSTEKETAPKKRAPRRRKTDERELLLNVKLEAQDITKELKVTFSRPLGRLKREVAVLFGEPGSFVMHTNVTAENPKGEFLTKKLLRNLKSGDTILLIDAPAKEESENEEVKA